MPTFDYFLAYLIRTSTRRAEPRHLRGVNNQAAAAATVGERFCAKDRCNRAGSNRCAREVLHCSDLVLDRARADLRG